MQLADALGSGASAGRATGLLRLDAPPTPSLTSRSAPARSRSSPDEPRTSPRVPVVSMPVVARRLANARTALRE